MPVYDYKCVQCKEVIEIHAPMDSAPAALQPCDCGGMLRKVFSAPGIIFKSSGFYSKDNRRK